MNTYILTKRKISTKNPEPVHPAAIHQAAGWAASVIWCGTVKLRSCFKLYFKIGFFISVLQTNWSTLRLILATLWAVEIRFEIWETRPHLAVLLCPVFKLLPGQSLQALYSPLFLGFRRAEWLHSAYPRPRSLARWFIGFQLNLVFILLVGSWSPWNSML